MVKPIIGLTARRLDDDRVRGWTGPGMGERDKYLARVRAAGGIPVLLDPNSDAVEDVPAIVDRIDGLILTGGPDVEPHRYGAERHEMVYGTDAVVDDFELACVHAAYASRTPLLAICRGLQVFNVAFGGTLHQHIPDLPGVEPHGRPGVRDGEYHHVVTLMPDSRVAVVMGTTTPTSSCNHHPSVDRTGPDVRVVGKAHDGIVEALEHNAADWCALAVEWHPEDTAPDDPAQQRLFDELVRRASGD